MFPAVRRSVRAGTPLTHAQGALLVAASGFVFSFSALTVRAAENASDWQFLVYRAASVAVAMTVLLLIRFGRDAPGRLATAEWRHYTAGLVLAASFILSVTALYRTSVATVLLMLGASPFWAALTARIWLGEALSRVTLVAMVAAASGVGVMVSDGLEAGTTDGVVLAASLMVALGTYPVLIRSARTVVEPAVPALVAGLATFAIAAVVVAYDGGFEVSWRDGSMGIISGGVLLGIGLPLFNLGHRAVPAAEVTLLMMTEVVLGPVWVWIWPGERPPTQTLIGGAIVIAALVSWGLASDRPR